MTELEEIERLVKEYYKKNLTKKRSDVPVSGKKFDEKELIYSIRAVLKGHWTDGEFTSLFEGKLKSILGVNFCSVVNSGSSANLLALKALTSNRLKDKRLKPGDEVITVAAGFPTTVNPIIQAGCVPVFCDVDLETHNIEVDQLEEALSDKTRAVMIAHTLGNPFDLKAVKKFCDNNNLWLIEDCCDALGSKYDGKYVSTFGDVATFSFYPAHQITMAEGGAVVTDNPMLHKIIKSFRDWGRDCWCPTGKDNTCGKRFGWCLGKLPEGYDHKYIYSELGYNLKNTDINVAIGLAQLDKLPDFIKERKENFRKLKDALKEYDGKLSLPVATENSDPCWFGMLITLKEGCGFARNDITHHLNSDGIATRLLFSGNILKQPYFTNNDFKYRVIGDLKNTDYTMDNSFWIGVCPLIEDEDIERVVKSFESFFRKVQ